MFHITCKGQNGVVKSFFPISTRTATRASQRLAAPSGCGARLRAPALPRTAVREEAPGTAGGRLGLHQAWWGGGRGAGGPGARFRGLRGRGRRFGERGPDPESGSGARGGQPRAAGGARPRRGDGRAAGRVRGGRAEGPRRQEETFSLTSGNDSESGLCAPRTLVRESQARRLGRVAKETAAD